MVHLARGSRFLGSPDRDAGSAMKFRFRPHMVTSVVTLTTPAVAHIFTAMGGLPILPPQVIPSWGRAVSTLVAVGSPPSRRCYSWKVTAWHQDGALWGWRL